MYLSKSLQESKSAITMRPVLVESTLLLFLLIQNFPAYHTTFDYFSAVMDGFYDHISDVLWYNIVNLDGFAATLNFVCGIISHQKYQGKHHPHGFDLFIMPLLFYCIF